MTPSAATHLTSRTLVFLAALAVFAACPLPARATITSPVLEPGSLVRIEADPAAGFHFPYLLRMPAPPLPGNSTFLLVEPNNTGRVSERLEDHEASARELAMKAAGADLCRRLAVPLLVPVFPRPETLYTHSLNRPTLLATDPLLQRLDLQLLAMIADARRRLAARGIAAAGRVLLTGFSASGSFANRFTILHPESVQAVAAGGINASLMLPLPALDDTALPYPLGTGDFQRLTGAAFDAAAWRAVPQFLYMGAKDTNDAVEYDDAYSDAERKIIYGHLGRPMQPDRWERCQQLYREAGANVTFRTYENIGHGTNGRIHAELEKFFRQAMQAAAPEAEPRAAAHSQ